MIAYRYFITEPGHAEREVTEDEWCRQERRAGFRLGHGPDDLTRPATAGFSGQGLSGRVEVAKSAFTGWSYETLWQVDAVARTVCVSDDVMVDVDAAGRVAGVETLDGSDWRDALAVLARQGRLVVGPVLAAGGQEPS